MNARRIERLEVLCKTDRLLWNQGIVFAGIDEAGRGPLAGNVVAACVIMPPEPLIEWVDDSKKLSEKRREMGYEEIMKVALYAGGGQATPEQIDKVNILNATKLAMRDAAMDAEADLFLIDAVTGLGLRGEERGIIHGDALSYSIAAASVVASAFHRNFFLLSRKIFSAISLNIFISVFSVLLYW